MRILCKCKIDLIVTISLILFLTLFIEWEKFVLQKQSEQLFRDGFVQLTQAPLYRLAALIVWLLSVIWLARCVNPFKRAKIEWWVSKRSRRPKVSSAQTWKHVLSLASLEDEDDPIYRADHAKLRFLEWDECLILLFVTALGSSGLAVALDYIIHPRVPGLLIFPTGDSPWTRESTVNVGVIAQVSNNLTAYLAIIGAAVALYVAQFSIRAQVRAKSRQEWTDKVRQLTANLISDIDRA